MTQFHLATAVLLSSLMLGACGGSSDGNSSSSSTSNLSNSPINTETELKISGKIIDKNAFSVPCKDLKSDALLAAAQAKRDYAELQFESASSGIVFRIVLPTKASLYKNALGRYAVLGAEDLRANGNLPFLLNVKVPYGDLNGERFYSNISYSTDKYYTELTHISEEKKADGKVTLLLKFKFNHEMMYFKEGILQANSELNNGELNIRVEVADQ